MATEDALLPIESEMPYSLHLAACCLNSLCASIHASPSASWACHVLPTPYTGKYLRGGG